ncbi:MAG: response regulator [Armatimonadetes bacterium]|nr:response regulator [Armatimonadota bacterium]
MIPIARLHVLLLEDSPLDADLIVDWLGSDGLDCRVHRVQTREDYLAALREGCFDLILADYSLPSFDGIEALEIAQQERPNWPFIFVSGRLGEELAIETLKRGATDYVLKSRLERLLPSVKRALREAKERDERRRIETTLQILAEASLVLSSLDYATTLARAARLAVPHFADYCLIDVVAENGNMERVAVAHADAEQEPLVQQLLQYGPVAGWQHPLWEVMDSGRSQLLVEVSDALVEEIARDERHLQILQQLGVCSAMVVPLLADGRTLGVMSLVSSTPQRNYSPLDLSLAEDLARRCAMAVENARLHRKTLDALKARDEFLAVLSHELRSPLTAILGWSQIIQGDDMDRQTLAHGLSVIERNAATQARLIEDLLEVSSIITGRLKLQMAPVALAQVVQNGVNSLAPVWERKGIEVEFSNRVTSDRMLGDEPRLQQIVWNLISNAIKFTPRGGRIEVTLEAEGPQFVLGVKDSGEGISPEFMPFLFDRFRQADSTSTRRHGGLGLGLAIVRHLAEMHGGTVQACSDGIGHGATFSVRLPQLPPSKAPDAAESPPAARSNGGAEAVSLDGLKVLLVEDGDDARELLATALRMFGAQVATAASAQEAMDALGQNAPDVLVSDIAMPGEDGYALMRRVKAWASEHNRHLPALALTAYAGEQDRLQALSVGFAAHLAKPVEPGKLAGAVASLLRNPPENLG